MLRIAKSLITIAAVAAIAVGATGAYFTDQVTIANNQFKTGTIAINVDGVHSGHSSYVFTDMKPGFIENSDFKVENTGSNPANIYKTLDITTDSSPALADVIDYNLHVAIISGSATGFNQVLYDYDVTMANIDGNKAFLGMLPVGSIMQVYESYRMKTTADDTYQGLTMAFDIIIDAEQLQGTLVLENKDSADWDIAQGDGISGELTYGVMDKKFNYTFVGNGLVTGTDYTLVMGSDYPFAGGAIGNATAVAGVVNISDSIELGNKTNQKVWLIPTANYAGGTMAGNPWSPASYLFETGLIDYYDSGV